MRRRATLLAGVSALALMAMSPARQELLLNRASLIPALDLNFLSGGAIDPRIAFTRASGATYYDSTGTLQTATSNTPRLDYDPTTLALRGLLIEEQRTNAIRNARAEGSVTGTPGTMPPNWSVQNVGSITSPVTGVAGSGTETGIPYVDLSLAGTLPAGGSAYIINFETVGIIAALTGQAWGNGLNYRVVSGALPGGSVQLQLTELTSAGGNVTTQATTVTSPTGAGLATQRPTNILTLSGGATTAFVRPNLKLTFNAGSLGTAFAFVLRIGGTQSELGASPTSLILPAVGTPAATTRAVDMPTMPVGSWFNPATGTLVADVSVGVIPVTLNTEYAGLGADSANLIRAMISVGGNSVTAQVFQGGASSYSGASLTNFLTKALVKMGFTYTAASLGVVVAANGGAVVSGNASAFPPSLNTLFIGGSGRGGASNGYIRRIRYWPRALLSGELQKVTM